MIIIFVFIGIVLLLVIALPIIIIKYGKKHRREPVMNVKVEASQGVPCFVSPPATHQQQPVYSINAGQRCSVCSYSGDTCMFCGHKLVEII
jgi:hypothetical protein